MVNLEMDFEITTLGLVLSVYYLSLNDVSWSWGYPWLKNNLDQELELRNFR